MGDVISQDELIQSLIAKSIHLDSNMIHSLIEGLIINNELDRALLLIRDLRSQGVVPKRQTYNLLISTFADRHEPEETFKLLLDFKEAWGDSSIPERDWWFVLEACANDNYVPSIFSTPNLLTS
jgi:pentatricopeptide repeat protein